MKKLYAIFGGNFDPIHYGHLYSAEQLAKEISIKKIIFLPNNNPPHRKATKTSIIDKLKMIKLAIHGNSLFKISYLEAKKTKIFFTIDTLQKIRTEVGNLQPLCLIIGEDNLQNLNIWKNWKKILSLSHLIILPRKCIKKNNNELNEWINSYITKNTILLYQQPYGLIFFSHIPVINISSSQIRKNYYNGKSSYGLLPLNVEKYIMLKKMYYTK